MIWKNMKNRNGWDFRQEELAESLDELKIPPEDGMESIHFLLNEV